MTTLSVTWTSTSIEYTLTSHRSRIVRNATEGEYESVAAFIERFLAEVAAAQGELPVDGG